MSVTLIMKWLESLGCPKISISSWVTCVIHYKSSETLFQVFFEVLFADDVIAIRISKQLLYCQSKATPSFEKVLLKFLLALLKIESESRKGSCDTKLRGNPEQCCITQNTPTTKFTSATTTVLQ